MKFKHRGFNPKKIIIRLSIVTIVFMMWGGAYYSYRSARKLILETLKEAALVQVQEGVDKIDTWLAVRKSEVSTIANSTSLKTLDWTIAGPYLEAEADRIEEFYHFALVFPSGEYYVTHIGKVDANVRDRPHIQMGLSGKVTVSNPLISRVYGIPLIIVVAPIWVDSTFQRKVIGLNTAGIDINRLSNVVKELGYGEHSYAFALNSEGAPIIHPDSSKTGTLEMPAQSFLESESDDLRTIAKQMVEGIKKIELATIDNESVFVAQVPLREADWSIALVIPRRNIEEKLRPLDLMFFTIIGLVGAFIILLIRLQEVEKTQLKFIETKLRNTLKQEKEINQLKSQFVNITSHEFRNPVASISLTIQNLIKYADRYDDQKKQKSYKKILQACNQMRDLLDELLILARLESGKLTYKPDFHNFNALCQEICNEFELIGKQKLIDVDLKVDGNYDCLWMDKKLIAMALRNIISNAIKYSYEDSTVCFAVSRNASFVSVQISDHGIGIAEKDIENIFQSFQRGSNSESIQGTGLGLSITKQVIELCGGLITVESSIEQGSVFTVKFPYTTSTPN
ncbi:sensor histidine kinase [Thalassoporum mexicanum]|uniref:sensor histidine kinase n=1 Tax=Thalassoporum mexicanum TaxID=3457544 RepID=UPI0018DE658D|nr:sensor histidine kinase [Pseudanabaena sp. PCC 7367]